MGLGVDLGLTGVRAAQRSMLTIGHNITNANTDGYSRQDVRLTTETPIIGPNGTEGQGVKLSRIERSTAEFLNSRLLEKQSALGREEAFNVRLRDLEGVFNEPSDFGIKNAMTGFTAAVQEFSKNPENNAVRIQMLERAKSMTNRFNLMASDINSMTTNVKEDIKTAVSEVNILTSRVADLNSKISALTISGLAAHDLEDQRDITLTDLSKLIDINVKFSGDGTSKIVKFGGREIVSGANFLTLSTNTTSTGDLELIFKSDSTLASATGGKLKGLIDFQSSASTTKGRIDTLVSSIVDQFNRIHSEGVGTKGGFSSLTGKNGVSNANAALNTAGLLPFTPSSGDLFVTVTNTVTGDVVKNKIAIDVTTDTLTTLTAKIDAIANVSSLIVPAGANNFLRMTADSGFTFDFTIGLDPNPMGIGAADKLGGVNGSTVSMDGIFTGSKNDQYRFTVANGTGGNDTIGVTPGLKIRVTDIGSTFSRDFDIGDKYTVGDTIDTSDGVKIKLTAGTVSNGDTFITNVLNDSDQTNLISSLGINTFFSGTTSDSIEVVSDIDANIDLIAGGSSSGSVGDNSNAKRMVDLQSKNLVANRTFNDHMTETVTLVGLDLEANDKTLDAEKEVLKSLKSLKNQTDGVSIDEELANLIKFEQMFNASARFISVINSSLDNLLNILT